MRDWMPSAMALLLASACATPPEAPVKAAAPERPVIWTTTLGRTNPLVGRIWSADSGFISRAEYREQLTTNRYVLLGETHDNPDHHRLQAAAIDTIKAGDQKLTVVFEMIPADMQPALDQHLGMRPMDSEGIRKIVDWDHSGWPEWDMYRPVFEASVGGGTRIRAANLPRSRAMEIARGNESAPEELVERHGLDEPLPGELQADLNRQLVEGHCGHLPESMIPPMAEVQRIRDAMMAEEMLDAKTKHVVLIAGGGHVRTDRAVPYYLRRQTDDDILSVRFVEVRDGAIEVSAYAEDEEVFDILYFTPRADDTDHCAELEKMFRKTKSGG